MDSHKHNSIIKKDIYPLPQYTEIPDVCKVLFIHGPSSGYWHIELDEVDREKTAFIASGGLHEFKVIPFLLKMYTKNL